MAAASGNITEVDGSVMEGVRTRVETAFSVFEIYKSFQIKKIQLRPGLAVIVTKKNEMIMSCVFSLIDHHQTDSQVDISANVLKFTAACVSAIRCIECIGTAIVLIIITDCK